MSDDYWNNETSSVSTTWSSSSVSVSDSFSKVQVEPTQSWIKITVEFWLDSEKKTWDDNDDTVWGI